jgi:hypothetical protein
MKTLIFCTAWSTSSDRWHNLFGRWINHLEDSDLEYDQILLIDDGSPMLPDWDGVRIVRENAMPDTCDDHAVIYHFNENLGRGDELDYPGWYRSFMFAAEWAERYGFDKIIHIESDAFLISERIVNYVNNLSDQWTTFWCPRHDFPENNIQIIAGSSVQDFIDWKNEKIPYEHYRGRCAEYYTPYTNVVKAFYGDRWGEFAPGMARVADPRCPPGVPRDADYVCQVFEESPCWWINS